MKRTILVILFTFFFVGVQAQDFSLTDQGNQWIYTFYTYCFDDPQCEEQGNGSFALRINGTTTFNNIEYSIQEIYSYQNPDNGWSILEYLREDAGIIYKYNNNGSETIYLDFTLETGDTITFENDANDDVVTVTSVNTQLIAGKMRKVLTLSAENYSDNAYSEFETIIEGIGFTGNPTSPLSSNPDFSTDITCFTDTTNELGNCALLGVETPRPILSTLYPNPLETRSTLFINSNIQVESVEIFSINGQLVSKHIPSGNSIEIDRSDLNTSGIYLYRLVKDGQIIKTEKFIVN